MGFFRLLLMLQCLSTLETLRLSALGGFGVAQANITATIRNIMTITPSTVPPTIYGKAGGRVRPVFSGASVGVDNLLATVTDTNCYRRAAKSNKACYR